MTAAPGCPPESPEGIGWPIVVKAPFELADGRIMTFDAYSNCPCPDCQEAVDTMLADAPPPTPHSELPW